MIYELMDRHDAHDRERCNTPEGITPERFTPVSLLSNPLCSEMSLSVLAEQYMRELDSYRRGEPCTDTYGLELLRRASMQGDQEAKPWVQHCLGEMVREWLRYHPQREVACRLESEENYVAQTFERFWQTTAFNQRMECSTLATALRYLRASLHGAILDTLRAYARPGEISKPMPGELGEPQMDDVTSSNEVWDILKTLLSNPREVRLAHLLFHSGLGPQEIVNVRPHEFDDVREASCLRRTIMERVLRNAGLLQWQLR